MNYAFKVFSLLEILNENLEDQGIFKDFFLQNLSRHPVYNLEFTNLIFSKTKLRKKICSIFDSFFHADIRFFRL